MRSVRKVSHIPCLDGLRGVAALWVLTGHAMLLSGWGLPIIDRPDYGVDLFILLSGFLMVFHYELRQAKEPWGSPTTWLTFWGRRFFRIAPLYYVALAVAFLAGPHIGHARAAIEAVLPQTRTPDARYFDQSLGNIIAHATFVFGQIPHFAFRTVLPDWSIGLEMAFYLVFPFLMLTARRLSLPVAALLFTAFSIAAVKIFPGYAAGFNEPAFLPLKLNIFFSGMLIAGALSRAGAIRAGYLILAVLLTVVHLQGPLRDTGIRIALACIFAFLVHGSRYTATKGISERIDDFLSFAIFTRMGDLSYGVYLIHLMVLIPVMGALISFDVSPFVRFLGALVMTVTGAYAIAAITFKYIEQPGIRLGKRMLTRQGVAVDAGEPAIAQEAG